MSKQTDGADIEGTTPDTGAAPETPDTSTTPDTADPAAPGPGTDGGDAPATPDAAAAVASPAAIAPVRAPIERTPGLIAQRLTMHRLASEAVEHCRQMEGMCAGDIELLAAVQEAGALMAEIRDGSWPIVG